MIHNLGNKVGVAEILYLGVVVFLSNFKQVTNSVQSRYPTQSTQSGKMNEGKNENDLWAFAFA